MEAVKRDILRGRYSLEELRALAAIIESMLARAEKEEQERVDRREIRQGWEWVITRMEETATKLGSPHSFLPLLEFLDRAIELPDIRLWEGYCVRTHNMHGCVVTTPYFYRDCGRYCEVSTESWGGMNDGSGYVTKEAYREAVKRLTRWPKASDMWQYLDCPACSPKDSGMAGGTAPPRKCKCANLDDLGAAAFGELLRTAPPVIASREGVLVFERVEGDLKAVLAFYLFSSDKDYMVTYYAEGAEYFRELDY